MGSELGQHVAGGGEAHGVAAAERVQGDVFKNHRLAHAVGADKDGVVAAFHEIEAKEVFNSFAVDLLWPGPIEVDHGLGGPHVCVARSSLEAAFLSLALFDGEHLSEPRLVDDLVAAGD